MTTYTVYRTTESAADAETGLTPEQVVQHIYRDDGNSYRLDPRMETPTDDDGNALAEQQVRGEFGLEWDVYFPKAGQQFGRRSNITAYGETEDEAESEFLDRAWRGHRWDAGKWCVLTDEQHANELAQAQIIHEEQLPEDPDFDEVGDLPAGIYSARKLNPPSGDDCTHLLVRDDGSLGWCYADGTQSEDSAGNVSTFRVADLCDEE